jgi:hypothetical protein
MSDFKALKDSLFTDPDRSAQGAMQPNDRAEQVSYRKGRYPKPSEFFSDHRAPQIPHSVATEGDQVRKPGISKRVRPNW